VITWIKIIIGMHNQMSKVSKTISTLRDLYLRGYVTQVGISGKDSFCVAHCAAEALKQAMMVNPNVGPLHVTTVDTTIDNFEIMDFLKDCHLALESYGEEFNLPIVSTFIQPKTQSRPLVQYIGRGLLLRTMNNQVGRRQCTSDWKITPLIDFTKQLKVKYQTDKILNLSGSRSSESQARAAALDMRSETIDVVTLTDMGYKLAPIKDWTLNDVWELINKIENGDVESFGEDLTANLRMHYSAGNSGACDLLVGNSTVNNKPCSSRFGCTLCSLVKEDLSLKNQIQTSNKQYGYMSGILELRNYMFNTLNDLELTRARYSKKLLNNKFIKLSFNDYSIEYRMKLLQFTLTLDALEIERAEEAGEDPKFQLIDYPSIVAIQFYFAREGGETSPGQAIKAWHDVHTLGNRYHIPKTEYTEPKAVAASDNERYFDIADAIDNISAKGLVTDEEENLLQSPHRVSSAYDSFLTLPFDNVKKFTIGENGKAWEYVEEIFPIYLDNNALKNGVCPTVILKDMINLGVIQMPQSQLYRLHNQSKIAQVVNYLTANNIKADEYYNNYPSAEKAVEFQSKLNPKPQLSLF